MSIGSVNIPRTIVAGDSVTWRDVAMRDNLGNQVSSTTHTLTYAIRGTQNLTLTATPYRDWETDRKSTRLNSSHSAKSRMPSSA